jgi:outer membrane protein TolC
MNLDACIAQALSQSHLRQISQFAVEVAEAQHRQALAGYWPQVGVQAGYERLSDSPDFLFPANSFRLPASTAVITVPAGVLGPTAVQLPVSTPAQNVNVPAQDVKLMDPDVFRASADVSWLLYDGGMRQGYREQTRGLVDMMKEDSRRTDLEIIDSVKRMYFGCILARQLHQVGKDTLERMEATLNITESMYKTGSDKVVKTDYLDNKVVVETIRAMVALLEKNEAMAEAALANTMGLPWNASIKPVDVDIPFTPETNDLEALVGSAYEFSPDWAKVEAGIRAANGAVRTAESGHYPKLAITGEVHKWWNDYNAGMATENDKEGWTVGVGVEVPIFDGFLTRNKVEEAHAQVAKIKEEQFLLQEGIGIQIKDTFLGLVATQKSFDATAAAWQAAQESRDLNTRAYENGLVETEKVIRAQLMEALMCAQHDKARYDYVVLQSQLNLLVGTEVLKKLEAK